MKIHHIGYAVRDIAQAKTVFLALGYEECSTVIVDSSRKVFITFLCNNEIKVELIAPASPDSPVSRILKQEGPIAYHICYETDNFLKTTVELKKKGFIDTSPSNSWM